MKAAPFVAAGIAYLLFNAGNKAYGATRLNYYISKLSIRFEGATPVLYITLGVQNPSSASFTIRSLNGTLYANDVEISNISSFQLMRIYSNSQTFIVVAARLSLFGVAQEVINTINGGGIQQTLRIKGTVNVENIPVPIDISYKIL